ncbi:MAG: type I restriction enzyme HsdR N-terminal domain-containing protein [Prevotellaceae bacterium]|nr:type I restriction enzyme HsdR N-terminal domain-containing protein [Prevotellaceae bacterium]
MPYLAITNGDNTYCCRVNFETEKVEFLKEFPKYEEIC